MKSLLSKSVIIGGIVLAGIHAQAGSGQIGSATAGRIAPVTPLKESIWKDNASSMGRVSHLKPQNIFSLNSHSMKQESLEKLLQSYREFFRDNKIDVTINEKASAELLVQVEALASYIEEILLLPRQLDPLIKLSNQTSTRSLLGALVINHKFNIKKASFGSGSNLISHSNKGTPISTITYKGFIPSQFKNAANKSPVRNGSGQSMHRYAVDFDFSPDGKNGGLTLMLKSQTGSGTEKDFNFAYGSVASRVTDESFLTPAKIDQNITNHFFSRACEGFALIYNPTNQFISFPQGSFVKYTTESGQVRYGTFSSDGEGNYSYSEAELRHNPSLRETYGDVIKKHCSAKEIRAFKISENDVDDFTGISKSFIDFVTRESMPYRFNLERNTLLAEITCPQGFLCAGEKRDSRGIFEGAKIAY